ncbi:ACP S-malonyltransferase [Streptomyces sp. NBC_01217]|uniref:ACP S-malonyltransferase n=1 Tax=Streptomyces sp. NBC_01217 TaxID=2903779 RepID=UPI002E12D88D|nr:ACP S-malonyltransferase [Streptomyces sp. NBC_01217]
MEQHAAAEPGSRTGTAMVFPGMGPVRFTDVGTFMLANPYARRLVAQADEVLGHSLVDGFRDAEGDYSVDAQVAFLTNCVAMAQWAEGELGIVPDACAGPSFGEKALAAHVGALDFPDAVRMTEQLARCMDDYFATEHQHIVTCSFVRTPEERLQEILAEMDDRGEWYEISCHVDHDFSMLSLHEAGLERFERALRAGGGLPLYTMRPPMHCAAFGPLRDRAEQEVLSGLRFRDPVVPVVADQDGSVIRTGEGVRAMLLDSFVRPMHWPDTVAGLRDLGVGRVCVAGPDSLFGRVAVTTANFEVVAAHPRLAMQPVRRAAGRD